MDQSETQPEANAAEPGNEAERKTQGQKAGESGAPTAPSVGQTQRQTATDDNRTDKPAS